VTLLQKPHLLRLAAELHHEPEWVVQYHIWAMEILRARKAVYNTRLREEAELKDEKGVKLKAEKDFKQHIQDSGDIMSGKGGRVLGDGDDEDLPPLKARRLAMFNEMKTDRRRPPPDKEDDAITVDSSTAGDGGARGGGQGKRGDDDDEVHFSLSDDDARAGEDFMDCDDHDSTADLQGGEQEESWVGSREES
jgi:hypothetical protein